MKNIYTLSKVTEINNIFTSIWGLMVLVTSCTDIVTKSMQKVILIINHQILEDWRCII